MRQWCTAGLLAAAVAPRLAAQGWNDDATRALVARAIGRRAEIVADSTLRDFHARAHGFVFFLGQLGEGLAEPPRLIKSDELELQVYWKAPGLSKQRIIGWRDRTDLPTDISYHRDHLGIVQNNFGNAIRLGHGDEVRDVPHPLSSGGFRLYDFAIRDSLTVRLPQRAVRVYEVAVRPKDFGEPRVVGSLFIDVDTAELVVFRFSFTRAAYRDDTLEDISIVLENGLWNGRWWLPRRQEIEIRRRTEWLDLPARGIIRGRWEIGDYTFNVGLPDSLFRGPVIAALPRATLDTFPWPESLDVAIREQAGPAVALDLEQVRQAIGGIAGQHVISGLASARPAVGAVSDLLHFNRVEGLAVGAGMLVRPGGGPAVLRGAASYGFADRRLKGALSLRYEGAAGIELSAGRAVRDVGDERVIAPIVNSLLAQEAGRDYGDYVLVDHASVALRHALGVRHRVALEVGVERTRSLAVRATPASGSFRPNPALGVGTLGVMNLVVERTSPELGWGPGVAARLDVEAGVGDTIRYLRGRVRGRLRVPVGAASVMVLRGWAGWGSSQLPPYRSFVLGGRGTLVSDPFRAWGGRRAAYGRLEWQVPAPVPAIPLGPFLSTGNRLIVAPFVAVGWAGGGQVSVPWQPTAGVLPRAGVALEWFHRLVRLEAGFSADAFGLTLDVGRDLWEIL